MVSWPSALYKGFLRKVVVTKKNMSRRLNRQTNTQGHNFNSSSFASSERLVDGQTAARAEGDEASNLDIYNLIDSEADLHRHHGHAALRVEAWLEELSLYFMFLFWFVIGEFVLIIVNYHDVWSSDIVFFMIILRSTYYDMVHGPKTDNVSVVKVKIRLIVQISLSVFALIFMASCVTNQFVVETPVEFQVVDADNHVVETMPLWRWLYKGFYVVYGPDYFINSFDEKSTSSNASNIPPGEYDEINLTATAVNVLIQVLVCAGKFAVVRYILLNWELVIKSLTRLVRKW